MVPLWWDGYCTRVFWLFGQRGNARSQETRQEYEIDVVCDKKNTSINLYEQIQFLLPVGHNVDCNTVRIFAYASPGFKYARAVKQKVSNEAELLTSRKKPTVLQSSL